MAQSHLPIQSRSPNAFLSLLGGVVSPAPFCDLVRVGSRSSAWGRVLLRQIQRLCRQVRLSGWLWLLAFTFFFVLS